MKSFTVTGVQQGSFEPQLVTSKEVTNNVNLLNVVFETNPLGKANILIYFHSLIDNSLMIFNLCFQTVYVTKE